MSMSVDGLVSGMDTTALITQLLQAEAGPQLALKKRWSESQTSASAYRTVNTTFAAVRAAAEGLQNPDLWSTARGSSTSSSVAVSVGTKPPTGSLTFTVQKIAAAHGVVNTNSAWSSATSPYGASSVQVFDANGVSKGTITVDGSGTLADAAAAINANTTMKLSAAVVQVRGGATPQFALQVTSKVTGADSKFSLTGTGTFGTTSEAADAELKIGDAGASGAYSVYSATNTFDSVMPGATLTVSKADTTTPVTVTVAADPDAVASKVQSLVDAVNAAANTVRTYTNNSKGSTAALRGDFTVGQMVGQLLDAVSSAIGSDGSPAKVGFSLTKDGKSVNFDKAKFLTALQDTPELAKRMVGGTAAGVGVDGIANTADDAKATGIAGLLLGVSKTASDSTTGSLVKLAEGQDSLGNDIQDKINAWDLRLVSRKEMLTRQFSAMETALSSLKNQSTWLAGQISSLPKSS